MIAKNRAQLKTWIKNISVRVNVNENIILQNYMLYQAEDISYEDTIKVLEEIIRLLKNIQLLNYNKLNDKLYNRDIK